MGGSERAYAAPRSTQGASWRFVAHVFGVDAEPAAHRAAAHLHQGRLRRRDERVRLLGVDVDQDPALAARRDGHVAADQEREAAEHLLLGEPGLARDELADPVGERLVVRHTAIVLRAPIRYTTPGCSSASRDTPTGSRRSSASTATASGCRRSGGSPITTATTACFSRVPGTNAHLELTTGGAHRAPEPHPETLIVLYLGSDDAVAEVRGRVGAEPVEPANPYWRQHGTTIADPDGFRVVLVPRPWPDA